MLMTEGKIRISSELMQHARRKWETSLRRTGRKLPFKQLLAFMNDFDLSFADIAIKMSLTRERVHQIYLEYFHDEFLRVRGKCRQEIVSEYGIEKRRLSREKILLNSSSHRGIARRARKHSIVIKVPRNAQNGSLYQEHVVLNGHSAKLSYANKTFRPTLGKREYLRVWVSKRKIAGFEYVIVIANAKALSDAYFVIPTQVLLDGFNGKTRDNIAFYIPTTTSHLPYNNIMPKIRFWDYHEAWHLFTNSTSP